MPTLNISAIIGGDKMPSLAHDPAASRQACDAILADVAGYETLAPRYIYMLSRYVFSALCENDQRRWAAALVDPAVSSRLTLIGTGGGPARTWDRAKFILDQIPAQKQGMITPGRLAELKKSAVAPGPPESIQARARRTGAQ